MRRRLAVLSVGVCALTLACSGVALAEDGPYCEFPAQPVELQRSVNITNTAPQIEDVETDVCGNVVGHAEQMTRTLTSGPWTPAAGPTSGTLVDGTGNVRLANSPAASGWSGGQVVPTGPLVG